MPRCKYCSSLYKPARTMQPGRVCNSIECQAKHAEENIAAKRKKRAQAERIAKAEDRKVVKAKLDELKTRPQLVKALGIAFRAWVRTRDEGKLCISCDKPLIQTGKLGGDYDAGHYRSVGSAKHLEFDERNVHGQCKYCNNALKSNPQGYRPRLIDRIGLDAVLALEADQEDRKYSKDDLRNMRAHYIAKTKELRK